MHTMHVIAFAVLAIALALMAYGLIYSKYYGHSEDYDKAYFTLFLVGVNALALDIVLWLIIGVAHLVAYLP